MFQAEQSVLIFQMIPYMTCCKTAGSRWLLNVASMTSPISASRVVSAVSGSLSEMLLPRKKPRSWELVRHAKMVKSAWLCKTQKIPNAVRRPFLLYVKIRRKTMIPHICKTVSYMTNSTLSLSRFRGVSKRTIYSSKSSQSLRVRKE